MGIVMGANGLGALVGPLLGGFLYEYAGYKSSFILCAGMSFLFSSFSFLEGGEEGEGGSCKRDSYCKSFLFCLPVCIFVYF